jgi:hypothetical protein
MKTTWPMRCCAVQASNKVTYVSEALTTSTIRNVGQLPGDYSKQHSRIQSPSFTVYVEVKLSRYRHAGDKGGKYTSCSFSTSALDGGEWSASRPRQRFTRGKEHPVPIGKEAGWAPELIWTQRLQETSFASAGDRTSVTRFVVRHYTD